MSIIASNFTKILAERNQGKPARYQVRSGTVVKEIKEVTLGKQKALNFMYVNDIIYEPDGGRIVLEGEVLVLTDDKEAKETIESFEKTKRFAPALMEKIYNAILQRTSVQSLVMARDIGLPPPLQLPRVNYSSQLSQQARQEAPKAAKGEEKKEKSEASKPSKSTEKAKKK